MMKDISQEGSSWARILVYQNSGCLEDAMARLFNDARSGDQQRPVLIVQAGHISRRLGDYRKLERACRVTTLRGEVVGRGECAKI